MISLGFMQINIAAALLILVVLLFRIKQFHFYNLTTAIVYAIIILLQ